MDPVLGVGLIMLVGFLGGRIASRFGLPSLTGYIVFGLFLGPYGAGLISLDLIESIKDPLSVAAVSIIAFMLGGDLTISAIKNLGSKLLKVAGIDTIWTYVLVFLGLYYLAGQPAYIALPLAALATSPAPTVVVPVVKELKARGKFTDSLLMVSALEDITCVILISISIAISRPLIAGGEVSLQSVLISLAEIGGSALFGAALGFATVYLFRLVSSGQPRLLLVLTMILVGAGLTSLINFSALITILTMGFVVLNFARETETLFASVEEVASPVLLLFFTVAGATLQPGLIPAAGIAVAVYIGVRIFSKMSGVYASTRWFNMDQGTCRYLPRCLLSQAGTTIGLTMLVAQQLPEVSSQILTVMLSAVIFFEIVAPPLTRSALVQLGEAECSPTAKYNEPLSEKQSG